MFEKLKEGTIIILEKDLDSKGIPPEDIFSSRLQGQLAEVIGTQGVVCDFVKVESGDWVVANVK